MKQWKIGEGLAQWVLGLGYVGATTQLIHCSPSLLILDIPLVLVFAPQPADSFVPRLK